MEQSSSVHASVALPLGRQLEEPRLGRPQSRSGRYGEDRNLLPLPGIEPEVFGRPARSIVTILTELVWRQKQIS
jgi:hypothetical protein